MFSGYFLFSVYSFISFIEFEGISFGLDFSGGTQIEVSYEKPVFIGRDKKYLKNNGYDDAQVTNLDTNLDVRIKVADQGSSSSVTECISLILNYEGPSPIECDDLRKLKKDKKLPEKIELQRVGFVGPQVGDELSQGGLGMLVALFMILFYVAFRFQYKFALGAVTT